MKVQVDSPEYRGLFEVVRDSKFHGYIVNINGKERFIHHNYIDKFLPLESHSLPNGIIVDIKDYNRDVYEAMICRGHDTPGGRIVCIFSNNNKANRNIEVREFITCPYNPNHGYKYEIHPKGILYEFKYKIK